MTAGQQGFNAQEIVDKANELGLTVKDNGPWQPPMRKSAGAQIRNSKHLVNIGASRYAHIAFPGALSPASVPAVGALHGQAKNQKYFSVSTSVLL